MPTSIFRDGGGLPSRRRSAGDLGALATTPAAAVGDLADLLPCPPQAHLEHVPIRPYVGRDIDVGTPGKGARAALELGARLADDFPAYSSDCRTIYPIGFSPTVPLRVTMRPHTGGPPIAAFAKYIDADARALDSIERESRFAAWAGELGVAPALIRFSREKRYMLTAAATGGLASRAVLTQPAFICELMRLARTLHRSDATGLPSAPIAAFPLPLERVLAESVAARLLPAAVAARLRRYGEVLAQALGRYPAPEQPIHGDLQHGNLLVDVAAGRLTLVDFGLARIGDAMADIAYFAMSVHLPAAAAGAMLAAYHAEDAAPPPSDLPRLQLHISRARLVRYVQSLQWWPCDHQLRARIAQDLHADLATVRPLLAYGP